MSTRIIQENVNKNQKLLPGEGMKEEKEKKQWFKWKKDYINYKEIKSLWKEGVERTRIAPVDTGLDNLPDYIIST